jgi:hypothetical protein
VPASAVGDLPVIFAQALGLLDIEGRLGLAKFFESPIDSFERIVEIT